MTLRVRLLARDLGWPFNYRFRLLMRPLSIESEPKFRLELHEIDVFGAESFVAVAEVDARRILSDFGMSRVAL